MALYTRKIQANIAEMDHLRTNKSKLLESRQELINQMEELKIQNSGHKERYEELRSNIRRMDIRLENLIKLRGEIEFQQQNNENFALQKKEKHTLQDYFNTSYEDQMKNIKLAVHNLEQDIKDL